MSKLRGKYRTLVVNGETWTWKTRGSYVDIRDPQDRSWGAQATVVTGLSWDAIERGHWKKTQDGMITPGIVRAYIDKQVLPKRPK